MLTQKGVFFEQKELERGLKKSGSTFGTLFSSKQKTAFTSCKRGFLSVWWAW
jgi:hypothetical protein